MRLSYLYVFLAAWCCMFFSACSSEDHYAPVTDISHVESIPRSGAHRVAKNETLYAIAWRFGLDYRYLARLNNINPPYTIQANQVIYLHGRAKTNTLESNRVVTAERDEVRPVSPIEREPNYSVSGWFWPARGRVINGFSTENKGINIAGQFNEPIYAAAAGKVVYSGNGLRGYGNLIIIKHNSVFLSAYAHNNAVIVHEGEWVKKGQKIAEMGKTGTDKVMLHFEIRRAGKSIDPMSLYKLIKSS